MNKKLSFIALSALMLTACSNEDILENAANDGMVTFTIGIQQNATRDLNQDLSQGKMIDRLRYVVFDENDQFLFDGNKSTTFNRTNSANQRFETVEIPLVVGKTYHIVFFADNNGSGYTISNDGVLDMNYNNVYNTNDESRDAFYKYESVKISKGVTPAPVILNRPFAQINVASTADDVNAAKDAGVVVENSKYDITGNVYSKLNMLTGEASEPIGANSVINFAMAARPAGQISVDGTAYEWLSMVYVLPEAEGDILPMVKFSFDENPEAREYASIPVKRNYRTNIVGNILTQTNSFEVILDTDFEKPDENVTLEPLKPNAAGKYEIGCYSDMVKLADTYKVVSPSEGRDIKVELTADVDMMGQSWPAESMMWVQFEGNGHTISNFVAQPNNVGKSGFFGYLGASVVKNVTFKNVTSAGDQAGIIAGQIEGTHFENVVIAGTNTVSYTPAAYPKYNETWPGVGAVVGVAVDADLDGVTIAEGAVINVNRNGIDTSNMTNNNGFAFFTNPAAVCKAVNNGTININNEATAALSVGAIFKAYESGATSLTVAGEMNCLYSAAQPLTFDKNFTLTGEDNATIVGYGFTGENNITIQMKGGNVLIEGVTFRTPEILSTWPGWAMTCLSTGGNITFRDCTFEGVQCPIYISDGTDSVTLDGCRFNTTGCAIQAEVYSGKTPAITITNCDFTGCADVFHYYQDGIDHAYLLNILDGHGNTYTGTVRATKYE